MKRRLPRFLTPTRHRTLSIAKDQALPDFKQFEIQRPNHIKIDVDGNEFPILKGMEETLNGGSVKSVLLELNVGRGNEQNILEFMAQKGFRVHSDFGLNHIFVRV